MGSVGRWVVGGVVALIGLVALYMAAKAHDATIYYSGLGVFIACILYIFYQIKAAFDRAEQGAH